MQIDYVPLLQIQRDIQGMPRDRERFLHYLRTIWNCYDEDFELIPLMFANPMAREHVTELLDQLLALGADEIAADATRAAAVALPDSPVGIKGSIVVCDDLKGGWTNRYDYEFKNRVGYGELVADDGPFTVPELKPPRWSKFLWVVGTLWSSEPVSARAVREAMLTAIYRFELVRERGAPRRLADIMIREGQVMALAGCEGPVLDDDDIAYTREVLAPHLDATDKRTCMECLFGDAAGRTLGFTPRGLSPWAGLALALHDARAGTPGFNR